MSTYFLQNIQVGLRTQTRTYAHIVATYKWNPGTLKKYLPVLNKIQTQLLKNNAKREFRGNMAMQVASPVGQNFN